MEMIPKQTETEIARRLAAALRPTSPNAITATQLRDWAVEYLADYDAELERFPQLTGKPHWNLWMMDARFEDALFAVLVFRSGGVDFLCGTGDAVAIKRFAERDFPDNADQLPPEVTRLFVVPEENLHLSCEAAEGWLGRGWF